MTDSFYSIEQRHPALAMFIRTGAVVVFCAVSFFVIVVGTVETDPVVTGHAYAVEAVR